ncbi:MAG: YCF48-related protein [Ignavibacteriota bacterium]|nr:YCF48-related protein [Ignavibacteriota bacterium]
MKKILSYLLAIFFLVPLTVFSQTGWFQVYSGINPSQNNITNIVFVNQLTGFASGGSLSSGYVIKTTNSGQSWNTVLTGGTAFQSLSFVSDLIGYAVGGYNPNSLIYKTTDGGQTWTQQISGTVYCYFDSYFINANTGYVVGDWGNIRKTTNGGNTWSGCASGTPDYLYSVCFVNLTTGFSVGTVGQIVKTTDGGSNWSQLIQLGSSLNRVKFLNETTGYVVGTGGKLLKTTDCGGSWQILSLGITSELTDLFIVNQNIMYIVGVNGLILKTANGGQNWTQQSTGASNTLLAVYFLNDQTGYTGGANASIYKTQTGGELLPLPVLISPPNNSYNVPLTTTLAWSNISGVTNYLVQVSSLSNFSTITDSATVTLNQRVIPAGKLQVNTTYFWRVRATNSLGTGPWTDPWNFGTTSVGINQISSEVPSVFKVYQNYPNPFNPETKIKFDVPERTFVTLKIYDISGKEITSIFNGNVNAGKFEANWNASEFSTGVYFLKFASDKFSSVKKIILTK